MLRRIAATLFLLPFTLNALAAPDRVDVFVSGEGGYHTYRIPAVETTTLGTVLAFAEGRKTRSDHAGNDIVLRRSEDGGMTWGPVLLVATADDDALNNPCVVTVRPSGRVLLIFQHYPAGTGEKHVVPGVSGAPICRNYLVYSDDDGNTWSDWRDITAETKRPEYVTSIASGPGNGIQLKRGPHAGRIVFPMNQGPYEDWRGYAIYSDDQGETWHYGDVAPNGDTGMGNEVLMAEMNDGSVRLNSRSHGTAKLRKTAVSRDGGEVWSALEDVPSLIEPRCNGGFIRVDGPDGPVMIYSGPNSNKAREKGTLHLSKDDGATWTVSRQLVPGLFAYSALTVLNKTTVGCLFETGENDPYERIQFAPIKLSWFSEKTN